MIDYEQFSRLKHLSEQLTAKQIAEEMQLDVRTVRKYQQQEHFEPRRSPRRGSLLDAYRQRIAGLLERHPYTAMQVFRMIGEEGYEGSYTLVKQCVRKLRPSRQLAYLTLSFAPGECAQVDWGYVGTVDVGESRRRLNVFVMVLCYSRLLYVEFTLSQAMEHFLSCQRHAFEFFGGVPAKVMVDNCKTAVLSHPRGGPVQLNPNYLDFARHYGFRIIPCNVRAGNEKGRVENAIGYLKKSLINGLEVSSLSMAQAAGEQWRDQVANCRVHAQTKQRPVELFDQEKPYLQPLCAAPFDCVRVKPVRANSQFRVHLESNRYSVPAQYASTKQLMAHIYPDRLLIYHQQALIAEHPRCYDHHQDIEAPEHAKPLLQQKRKAHEQQLWRRFLALGPLAEMYYHELSQRRLNPMTHVRQILALVDIHGPEPILRVMADTAAHGAYSSEYVANLLEQRRRHQPRSAPLHLTRNADLLDLELPPPNLDLYDQPGDTP